MVLANIAGDMYLNMLPLYLKSLDANVIQVGIFFTIAAILPLLLQIIGGWISDNLGRLRSVAIGSSLGVFSYIGLVLAPTWHWVLAGHGPQDDPHGPDLVLTGVRTGLSFSSFTAKIPGIGAAQKEPPCSFIQRIVRSMSTKVCKGHK